MNQDIVSGYLCPVLKPDTRERLVNEAMHALTPFLDRFDALAVRGMSGALFGGALALELAKPLIIVRKETSHGSPVEGALDWHPDRARYLIVDDFHASGDTVREMQLAIANRAYMVGMYMYTGEGLTWRENMSDEGFDWLVVTREEIELGRLREVS